MLRRVLSHDKAGRPTPTRDEASTQKKYSTSKWLCRCCSSAVQMPPCDFQPEPYKDFRGKESILQNPAAMNNADNVTSAGISYEDAKMVKKKYINPGVFNFYKRPVMIHQGHKQWLFDVDGKRYLDLFAGIVTVSVGHCHPKVTEAAEKQMKKLWHTTNIYMQPAIHEYARKLAQKLPEHLKVIYFVNSGSEANDLALLMSRMYTGVFDVVSLRNAYHGASPYLMGLTALNTWKFNVPTGFGIHQTMNADPFRGPWGGKHCRDSPVQTIRDCNCAEGQCEAGDKYAEQLEDVIRFSMPKGKIGAFFAEAIQGVGGTVQFPKNFLKKAFDTVKANGGVCISDEVQTGFGRTGTHYWGFEGHGVSPDIVVMAKGIGNGFPMGAVATTPEIAETMGKALHFNTFGGNPIACSVGSAVLDVIDEENIQQNAHEVGTYFLKKLGKMQKEFDIVGDVRGKGLMIGVELVTDKKSRTPLPAEEFNAIWEDMKDMGVLVGKGGLYGTALRIKPPMCVTKEDADFGVEIFRKALQNATSKK